MAERRGAVVGVGGRGLAGSAHDLAEQSGVNVVLEPSLVPCYRGAKRLAAAGATGDDDVVAVLAAAPETSGGLLAAVPPDAVDELVEPGSGPSAPWSSLRSTTRATWWSPWSRSPAGRPRR